MITADNIWWAVTVQKEDGHDIDAGFITNNRELISKFSKGVKPHMIYCSPWRDKDECLASIEEFQAASNAADINKRRFH